MARFAASVDCIQAPVPPPDPISKAAVNPPPGRIRTTALVSCVVPVAAGPVFDPAMPTISKRKFVAIAPPYPPVLIPICWLELTLI